MGLIVVAGFFVVTALTGASPVKIPGVDDTLGEKCNAFKGIPQRIL